MSATLNSLRSWGHTPEAPDYDTRPAEAREQIALDQSQRIRMMAAQDNAIATLRRAGLKNFTEEPVRDAQKAYIDSLLQRMSQAAPEVYAIAKPWCDAQMPTMTKRRASDVINRLKAQLATALAAQPEGYTFKQHDLIPSTPAPRPAWDAYDDIPTGYYAVSSDEGHTSFYHVLHKENKVYVKLQVSDSLSRIPWAVRQAALNKIREAGPKVSAERYARELNHCYRCGRTLTDEESRALGIGPTCRGKAAW